jgi:hypothetical protein
MMAEILTVPPNEPPPTDCLSSSPIAFPTLSPVTSQISTYEDNDILNLLFSESPVLPHTRRSSMLSAQVVDVNLDDIDQVRGETSQRLDVEKTNWIAIDDVSKIPQKSNLNIQGQAIADLYYGLLYLTYDAQCT